jgi:exopolysaccharide biosynthesis polyprenyl glycosylphosphotransferase
MSYQLFRRQILLNALKLSDLLIMVLSFSLATVAVHSHFDSETLSEFLHLRIKVRNFVLFLGFLIVWHVIFSMLDLYHSRRFSSRREEAIDIVKATSLGTLVILVSGLILNLQAITPLFLAAFWVLDTGVTVLGRFVLRYSLAHIRLQGRNLRHMMIVGTNPRAVEFARKIGKRPELGYHLIGFVDQTSGMDSNFKKTGYPLVTDFNGFPSFLRDHVIDEVVIALPMKSLYGEASTIAALCEEQGILVRYFSNPFNLKLAQSRADQFEDDTIITLTNGRMQGVSLFFKRVLDTVVSFAAILLLTPLFLIVGLWIRFTSPGPVFFVQERVGLNKRRFRLYKFRTMVADAEKRLAELEQLNEVSGPVFKIKNDPRITPIGKFLRKTSIDELPQLINVLKGDMSLVGPRPLPVRDYEGFDEDWHRRRFSVRPGITCLWQVNGRSNTSFDKWMKLDMEYIDKWSLALDLKILLKTIPAVLNGSGAA